MFEFIGQYFWLICIAIPAFQLLRIERRVADVVAEKPYQTEHVRHIYRIAIIATMVPWLVVGAGHLVGSTPAIWYYFRPQDLNPFVIAFLTTIFLMALANAYWVFFQGGARTTVDLKIMDVLSFGNDSTPSEKMVKIISAIGPFFVIAWIALAVSMDAKIPIHR